MKVFRLIVPVFFFSVMLVIYSSCGGSSSNTNSNSSSNSNKTNSNSTNTNSTNSNKTNTNTNSGGGLAAIADFKGGDSKFNFNYAKEQAYWYSRYNLGSLVMKSGNGMMFKPNKTVMGAMVKLVSDAKSTAVPAKNPALLVRIYATGEPTWQVKSDGNPGNFANERWAKPTDTSVTFSSYGWAAAKEAEWAKQFHVDGHFGIPGKDDIPGAQQRFAGIVLATEAVMQTINFLKNQGDFKQSVKGGKWVALLAISDVVSLLEVEKVPHSATNRYKKLGAMLAKGQGMAGVDDLIKMLRGGADKFYGSIKDQTPDTLSSLALAIQALPWYGLATKTNLPEVKSKIKAWADKLSEMKPNGLVEQAYYIRGLVSAGRALKEKSYYDKTKSVFELMAKDFDGAQAIFKSKTTYSANDLAIIFGALNAYMNYGSKNASDEYFDGAQKILTYFFENAVNFSKLQLSAPPIALIPAYERNPKKGPADELFNRYKSLPVPPKAGGAYGVAPVFRGEIKFDGGQWTVSKPKFHTAGGMHLANEFMWFHADEVDGFPQLP